MANPTRTVFSPPLRAAVCGLLATCIPAQDAAAAGEAALEARIRQLEQELEAAKGELERAREQQAANEARLAEAAEKTPTADAIVFDVAGGTLKAGGAMRVNYAVGDYPESGSGAASRAWQDNGNFALDTFRVNLDYRNGPFLGKLEYRWYDGYHFLHTGWVGYDRADGGQVQVGVNRVPFGPGPYGVSQSWFFDQHYYVGLSDDMDLGVKYVRRGDGWSWDFAYYLQSEGDYTGASGESARYSYDVVNESGNGYEERNQVNLRGIYLLADAALPTDLGFSLQYGQLDNQGPQDDGDHWAASLHMVNRWGDTTLATQLSRYRYDVSAAQPLGTDALVQFGAYDFPNTVAASAWVPAISLSRKVETPSLPWLDYVLPYAEYSAVVKDEAGFNDSEFVTLGAAWASGGWYVYSDLAFSNGNEFIGGEAPFGDRLGANADRDWLTRFNLNFGYYF